MHAVNISDPQHPCNPVLGEFKDINRKQFLLPCRHLSPTMQMCCVFEERSTSVSVSALISVENSYSNASVPPPLRDMLKASFCNNNPTISTPRARHHQKTQIRQRCNYSSEGAETNLTPPTQLLLSAPPRDAVLASLVGAVKLYWNIALQMCDDSCRRRCIR